VRGDFLFTCASSLVLYKIGRLTRQKHIEVVDAVCRMLRGKS
jgi:hypothetical protein